MCKHIRKVRQYLELVSVIFGLLAVILHFCETCPSKHENKPLDEV